MNVLFIVSEFESLGVEYLSSVLKAHGHVTDLIFDPRLFADSLISISRLQKVFDNDALVRKKLERFDPDLIGFSVNSVNYEWACRLSRKIKSWCDVPIAFGGIHPTSCPGDVIENSFIDYVIIGEAEYALLDLIDNLEDGEVSTIENVWSKKNGQIMRNEVRPLLEDLDSLPFPDKDLFYRVFPGFLGAGRRYTVMAGRGCLFNCSYCCNSYLRELYENRGKYVRYRSVDNVIDELSRARKYRYREVIFHDEILLYNKEWLREFSCKYRKEIDKPFFCWVNPNLIDVEIVSLLKHAGCSTIQMGIQTLNSHICQSVLNRKNDLQRIEKAIESFRNANIVVITDNMAGLPLQTGKDLIDCVYFYMKNRVDRVNYFWLTYFPNTRIQRNWSKANIETNTHVTKSSDRGNRKITRLINLVLLAQIVPGNLIHHIIVKRWYRFLPSWNLYGVNFLYTFFRARAKGKHFIPGGDGLPAFSKRYLFYVLRSLLGF